MQFVDMLESLFRAKIEKRVTESIVMNQEKEVPKEKAAQGCNRGCDLIKSLRKMTHASMNLGP